MDTQFFKITVRAIIAIYVLCKLWQCMISNRGRSFHEWLFPKAECLPPQPIIPVIVEASKPIETAVQQPVTIVANSETIVGQSQTVYLEKPIAADPIPAPVPPTPIRSESLELEERREPESDPTADEVDDTLAQSKEESSLPEVLSPDEMLIPVSVWDDGSDNEFSRGMTFNDLSNVADVVMGLNMDEDNRQQAAEHLSQIRYSDLFDFFSKQLTNKKIVANLLDEYIDGDGTVIKQKVTKPLPIEVTDFDMRKYV